MSRPHSPAVRSRRLLPRLSRRRAFFEPLERRQYFAAISFANHVDIAAGTTPVAIVTADFNGDGKLDLAVADSFNRDVLIFTGNGAGVFTAISTPLPITARPVSMRVGDFNGDGTPDIIVGTSPGGTATGTGVTVFINKADGTSTFNTGLATTVLNTAGSSEPIALTTGDFNGDGKLDVATANLSTDQVSILLGQGNGTFAAPTTVDVGIQPTAIAVGDFDGDGKLDLAVADQRINGNTNTPFNVITLLRGTGAGTFTTNSATDVALADSGLDILDVADLNGDGRPDLVVGSTQGTLAAFVNNGGAFSNSATVNLPAPSDAAAVADFNFDGIPDMLSVNGSTALAPSPNTVTVATGAPGATFPVQADFDTGTNPVAVAVGDFNGDGKPDLAVANSGGGSVSILVNNTAGTVLQTTSTSLASSNASLPFGAAGQLTATITGPSTAALPTGFVRFFDGNKVIATVAIADGTNTAVLPTTALDVGTHAIRAFYLGNGVFAVSHSGLVTQAITPTPGHGPDLSVSFLTGGVPTALVPGQRVVVKVLLTNVGNTIASGVIDNAVFLSSDVTVDGADTPVTLAGPLAKARVNLLPNHSVVLVGVITVPAGTPIGPFNLLAQVNTTGALVESDADDDTNNIAASGVSVENSFGNVGGLPNVVFTTTDSFGTPVTFRLIGLGTGTVTTGTDGLDVTLTGTNAASQMLIVTGGNKSVTLGGLTANSALGAVVGPKITFTDGITLPGGVSRIVVSGVGSEALTQGLTLGAGRSPVISLGSILGPLSSASGIQALAISGNFSSSNITAPWIGTLVDRGSLTGGMTLSGSGAPGGLALRAARVVGTVGGNWSIGGNVGQVVIGGASFAPVNFDANPPFPGFNWQGLIGGNITSLASTAALNTVNLAAKNIGAVAIFGDVSSSKILAGIQLGTDNAIGDGDDTIVPGSIRSLQVRGNVTSSTIAASLDPADGIYGNGNDVLDSGGSIGPIVITGLLSDDSRILAETLPVRVRIDNVLVTTAGDPRFTVNS